MSEETVLRALDIILERRHYPILMLCAQGTHRTSTVVGCLRKLQRWNLTSIFEEYRRYAGAKIRLLNEQFIELFDTDLVQKQYTPWPPPPLPPLPHLPPAHSTRTPTYVPLAQRSPWSSMRLAAKARQQPAMRVLTVALLAQALNSRVVALPASQGKRRRHITPHPPSTCWHHRGGWWAGDDHAPRGAPGLAAAM